MIDFHCHLDLYPKPFEIAAACRANNVYVLSVTTTPSAWPVSASLSKSGDRIRVALGLHPQIAHERLSELGLFDELVLQARYVGEIGLDGSPEYRAHLQDQLKAFDHILRSCKIAGGRILSIHSRHAAAAVLERLRSNPDAGTPILHWFSGSKRHLDDAIEFGCWFSVGPAMLRSERGKALVASMPPDRVLTESDGPFAKVDGRPATPMDVPLAVQELAELWKMNATAVEERLQSNLRTLVSPSPNFEIAF